MGNIKERVLNVLKKVPATRKSDNVLMAHLWTADSEKYECNIPELKFVKLLRDSKLTNWESATRVRRQLQSQYPELRDKDTYEKRKKLQEEYRQEYSRRS